jgi:hypothetical protein
MRGPLLTFALASVFWGGAVFLSPEAGAYRTEKDQLLYYPNGRFLQEAVLGYDQAAAALAWLQLVQYYGEHARGDEQFDYLYHMCDVTTELDPHFEEPYTFGAFVLLTVGGSPSAGMRLLQKGRQYNPQSWKILFESGFIYYIAWADVPKASHYFTQAAGIPGAPEYTNRFAAWVTYRSGDLRTSLLLWQELAERTTNPEIRRNAEEKIAQITASLESSPAGPPR